MAARLKNSETRKLLENFIALSVLQLGNFILPLITLPYLARVLGVKLFGTLAFAAAVVTYFQAIVDYGFHYTAVRDIARRRDDVAAVSRIFFSVLYARLLLMVVSFLILCLLIVTVPVFYRNSGILLLTFLLIPGHVLFPEWFFQAMERMKYIALLNFSAKLFFTVMVFFVIRSQADYFYHPVLAASGYAVSGLVSLVIIKRHFGIPFVLPALREVGQTIWNGTSMFLNVFLPNFYSNINAVFLGIFNTDRGVGVFDAANRFITISSVLTTLISRVFFPYLARHPKKHGVFVMISFVTSLMLSLLFFFGADLIVYVFYTDEFRDAATLLRIMAITPLLFFLLNAYGTNFLVLHNREAVLRNIIVAASVLGFFLSLTMILLFGYRGAAISLVLTRGLMGTFTYLSARRVQLLEIDQK